MLFGSVPRPPRKPRSSISTQSARQKTAAASTAIRASRASPRSALTQNAAPIAASAMTATRFTANPWAAVKFPNAETSEDSTRGCDVACHRLDHAGQPARLPVRRPLPEAAPRPGLEQRHAEEEHARPAERQPSGPRRLPGALGQRYQGARDRVDEHGSRRAEQHGQPRREDPAERLAECPDDKSPRQAGQPGEPGRPAARREDQPHAEADLDPDGRRAGLDRVVGPDGAAPVHQVLHPGRRGRRGRLDDLLRQAARHLRLRLQDPVEHPQDPEADPQQAPRARLVPRGARVGRRRAVSAGPGPRCAPRHQEQHEDERDDDPLMHQRRPEGGDDRGISGVQPRVHAWHGANPSPAIIVRLSLPQVT